MKNQYFVAWMLLLIVSITACTGNSDTSQSEGDSSAVEQNSQQVENADNASYTITFSTGHAMSPQNARVRYRQPQSGRRENGGIEFDSTIIQQSGDKRFLTGGLLRIYFREPVIVGDNPISEIVGEETLLNNKNEEQRFTCEPQSLNGLNIRITKLNEGEASGEIPSILLDECRDADAGGLPVDGISLSVEGTFENVPFNQN